MDNPFHELPANWVQTARPSPWLGFDVSRMLVTSYESEFETSTIVVSHIRKAAEQYFTKTGFDRWRRAGISSGDYSCLPAGFGDQVGWLGNADSTNLYIKVDWLQRAGRVQPYEMLPTVPRYGYRDRLVTSMIDEIYKDNQLAAPLGLAYSETLVVSLLLRLAALSMTKPRVRPAAAIDQRAIERAIEYIHANLDGRLGLEEIAAAAGFNENIAAFVRAFKRISGLPPHRYILETRLTAAKAMLSVGGRSVTAVAMACGFYNLSHFSSSFRTRWGISPSGVASGANAEKPHRRS